MFAQELVAFMLTAQEGSFQKASELLYISSTALIKQINSLEDKVGLTLFSRSNRGLSLTESGRIFYAAASDILLRYYDALEAAQNISDRRRNPVRIGVSMINPLHRGADSLYYSPDCFESFTAYIQPISSEYKDFIDEVRNLGTNVDMIPYFCGHTDLSAYCRSFCLARLPLRIAVPVTHLLAQKDSLDYSDLEGQEIITIRSDSNYCYQAFNEDIQQKVPSVRFHPVTHIDFRILNHAAMYGKILLVGNYLKDAHPLLKLLPVKWNHYLPYGLLYSHVPSGAVQALLQSYRDLGLSGKPEDAPIVEL